jgi:hypothetical protein
MEVAWRHERCNKEEVGIQNSGVRSAIVIQEIELRMLPPDNRQLTLTTAPLLPCSHTLRRQYLPCYANQATGRAPH